MKQTPASPHISEIKGDTIPEFGLSGLSCAWEGQGVLSVPQCPCAPQGKMMPNAQGTSLTLGMWNFGWLRCVVQLLVPNTKIQCYRQGFAKNSNWQSLVSFFNPSGSRYFEQFFKAK